MQGPALIAFLTDLAANNDRDWFNANKKTRDAAFTAPSGAFADAMAAGFKQMTGHDYSAKIFRLPRDVRFSKDKTPYNTYLRMAWAPDCGQSGSPRWMLGLEPGDLTLGVGMFEFERADLDAWRARIDGKDGAALAGLMDALGKDGVRFSAPDLKRVPAPYPQDHERGELLRRKGLTAWIDALPVETAFGDDGPASCLAEFRRLKPLFDWMLG
ncbi:DUF2461 domain-containing protein [Henriciella mobilis]|uniref:DUF2461 domain-containing protein n=1 Tax=Henriciella mobilis TaxID=2305467 RepID=UPI0013145B25|nr:DUF2461 domain-containing protein [Henriciella mobilis]